MAQKKNPNAFDIWFNPDIPRHALAIETLNALGRKKAEFVSRLIDAAARNPEIFGLIVNPSSDLVSDEERERLCSAYKESLNMRKPSLKSPEEKETFREEERNRSDSVLQRDTDRKREVTETPVPQQKEESRKETTRPAEEKVDVFSAVASNGEIPDELRESFLQNLMYFDDLVEDDDDE